MLRMRARASFAWALFLVVLISGENAQALSVRVVDSAGLPITAVMVTAKPLTVALDNSDGGYPQRQTPFQLPVERTRFSNDDGRVEFSSTLLPTLVNLRLRRPGWQDSLLGPLAANAVTQVALQPESDPAALAAALPANVWAAAIQLDSSDDKKRFQMQCGFCHQQGSLPLRMIVDEARWAEATERMVAYGARLPTRLQKIAPTALAKQYADLLQHPEKLAQPLPWQSELTAASYNEWPAGDAMSQMHDLLLHDGQVYVGDNVQDRLWIFDPQSGAAEIQVTPHQPDDALGGLIEARLSAFPRRDDYTALHSLAVSARDGHIFMTPSNQRRLLEYAPASKTWRVHDLSEGFYPHTIRIDAQDRVWFTLALSNQIGMFDRANQRFVAIDLPSRSLRESLTLALVPTLFRLAAYGLPIHKLPIDDISTGVPLPYGIDIAPDGKVWFARLHANDIGWIDPQTLQAHTIAAPFMGPRRLRSDAAGNLWIGAFGESAVYRFEPTSGAFTRVDMPTLPKGSDTPYSLAVDKKRNIVWVTGTASDTLNAWHVDRQTWSVFPLPRRMTFTREIDVAEDGSVFTSNGAFPAWHIEDGQPTVIQIVPPWARP